MSPSIRYSRLLSLFDLRFSPCFNPIFQSIQVHLLTLKKKVLAIQVQNQQNGC